MRGAREARSTPAIAHPLFIRLQVMQLLVEVSEELNCLPFLFNRLLFLHINKVP